MSEKVSETLQLCTGRPQLCQTFKVGKLFLCQTTRNSRLLEGPRQPPTNTSAMASKQTLAFFLVAMLALASTLELASSFCLGLDLHLTPLGVQRLDHEHAQRRR